MSLGHIWRILRSAWAAENARPKRRLRREEAEFLPAALEVIERPVSPTARMTAWVLLSGVALALVWLIFGRLDVVVSAQGKVIPSGSVKLVQSAGPGVVRAIHVHEGDRVRRGQPLIDLDPTLSGADLAQAKKALLAAQIDVARETAIADALAGRPRAFRPPADTPAMVIDTQTRLITARLAEVEATSASLAAARASTLAEASSASAQIAKLSATLPILDREVAAMERLDARGFAPGLRLLELQRQRRSEAGDSEIAQAQRARALSDAAKLAQQIAETREQARRTALADLAKAQSEMILRQEEVTKAARRSTLQRLTSPVDGSIQQLGVHTVGGVIEPARVLMVVVPAHDGLEIEAKLRNKDMGFVSTGQAVAVKFEAFPFTRYGTVPGRLVSLSRDAVLDPKLGSTYTARIALARATIIIDGRSVPLTAGLAATADIRTGTRTIISYLLSPLQTTIAQAARER